MKILKGIFAGFALLCSLTVVSCGGAPGGLLSDDEGLIRVPLPVPFSGIWGATSASREGAAGHSVVIEIVDTGELHEYAYQGNSLEAYQNCYNVTRYILILTGETISAVSFESDRVYSDLRVDSDTLYFSLDGTNNFGEDAVYSDLLEGSAPPLTGITPVDLTLCT